MKCLQVVWLSVLNPFPMLDFIDELMNMGFPENKILVQST